ncbi:MAG TPA: hypothetical protein VJ836_00240 [Candidatus Saccharimonadales bacterium]|nr:hypothetical protein [Candidatus Saccharimonadales bacterium]
MEGFGDDPFTGIDVDGLHARMAEQAKVAYEQKGKAPDSESPEEQAMRLAQDKYFEVATRAAKFYGPEVHQRVSDGDLLVEQLVPLLQYYRAVLSQRAQGLGEGEPPMWVSELPVVQAMQDKSRHTLEVIGIDRKMPTSEGKHRVDDHMGSVATDSSVVGDADCIVLTRDFVVADTGWIKSASHAQPALGLEAAPANPPTPLPRRTPAHGPVSLAPAEATSRVGEETVTSRSGTIGDDAVAKPLAPYINTPHPSSPTAAADHRVASDRSETTARIDYTGRDKKSDGNPDPERTRIIVQFTEAPDDALDSDATTELKSGSTTKDRTPVFSHAPQRDENKTKLGSLLATLRRSEAGRSSTSGDEGGEPTRVTRLR